jgi:cell division protein FtsL
MARNRKHESAAIRFGPTLKALLLCLLIGGAGVGYVWQKDQIYQLGRQIKQREVHLRELADQNEKLRKQLSTMRSPGPLEARIKELNLGLVQPEPSQVWRLQEPSRESPAQHVGQQYAARAAHAPGLP